MTALGRKLISDDGRCRKSDVPERRVAVDDIENIDEVRTWAEPPAGLTLSGIKTPETPPRVDAAASCMFIGH